MVDWRKLKEGQEVFWNDPDDDICSGLYKVFEAKGEVVALINEAGSVVEAFDDEIEEA